MKRLSPSEVADPGCGLVLVKTIRGLLALAAFRVAEAIGLAESFFPLACAFFIGMGGGFPLALAAAQLGNSKALDAPDQGRCGCDCSIIPQDLGEGNAGEEETSDLVGPII